MELLNFYTKLNDGVINEYRENIACHKLYSTDKQNHHDYIVSYYDLEFTPRKDEELKLLEIGVLNGNSLRLWKLWFNNIDLYGVDNLTEISEVNLTDLDGVSIYNEDAYGNEFVNKFRDGFFDYIIDDGPHTKESQVLAIKKWFNKVKSGGKLLIEDVKYDANISSIIEEIKQTNNVLDYKIYDFRNNKYNKYIYDSVIVEIIKS